MKLSICKNCNIEFKVGPGCKGIYCSSRCSYIDQKESKDLLRKQKRETRIKEYYLNPKLCKCGCTKAISFENSKNGKYFSSSCAASVTNRTRLYKPTPEHKARIAKILHEKAIPTTYIKWNVCQNCNKTFAWKTKRINCSIKCLSEHRSNSGALNAAKNQNNFSTRISNFVYKDTTITCDSKLECAAIVYLKDIKHATNIEKFRGILHFIDEKGYDRKFNPDFICYIDGISTLIEVKQRWKSTCNINSYNKYFNEKYNSMQRYCNKNNYNMIWLNYDYDIRLRDIYYQIDKYIESGTS